jgi:hypothetical protein
VCKKKCFARSRVCVFVCVCVYVFAFVCVYVCVCVCVCVKPGHGREVRAKARDANAASVVDQHNAATLWASSSFCNAEVKPITFAPVERGVNCSVSRVRTAYEDRHENKEGVNGAAKRLWFGLTFLLSWT